MPIIFVSSPPHCQAEDVVARLLAATGFTHLRAQQLLERAAHRFNTKKGKLRRAMYGPRPFFDNVTRERERHIAYLKAALAELIQQDNLIYHGFAGHLLPRSLEHVLRVCLVADTDFRVRRAMAKLGLSESETRSLVQKEDEKHKQWTLQLFGLGPWDERLYDMLIPMDKTSPGDAAREITLNVGKPIVASTSRSRAAARDFQLASRVEVELAEAGHAVDVECRQGNVTLIISKYVLRLEKHKKEISAIASRVQGVESVMARIGPNYHQPSIHRKLELPRKILLVDDEKEFVHTLSERLQTRNLESVVAYDGEQALEITRDDAPDVMVLDLKMPGIDGLEVLRRVKKEHPATEVIILTGHGSRAEQNLAMELGAFACLEKPVNIDILARTMKDAYQKVAQGRSPGSGK